MSDQRRVAAHRFGLRAETMAALALQLKGWTILNRRFKVGGGEIDIIARRARTIIFVEVKARATQDDALLAISATKQSRMARAANVWLSRNPWAVHYDLRGDAVLIAPRRWPKHLQNVVALE